MQEEIGCCSLVGVTGDAVDSSMLDVQGPHGIVSPCEMSRGKGPVPLLLHQWQPPLQSSGLWCFVLQFNRC